MIKKTAKFILPISIFILMGSFFLGTPSGTKAQNGCSFSNGDQINDNRCDFEDVTISSGVVTISGKHIFRSLTIRGTLIHEPATRDENYQTSNKRVDIETLGDITIDGGWIDVSEKGYPGGINSSTDYDIFTGGGPGGGYGLKTTDEAIIGANGGSFGGRGGGGYCKIEQRGDCQRYIVDSPDYPFWAYESYCQCFGDAYNQVEETWFIPPVNPYGGDFNFGSGGGFASVHSNIPAQWQEGGAGGGRVRLISHFGTIRINGGGIQANGEDGTVGSCRYGDEAPWSGAGSGGMIWLEAPSFNLQGGDDATCNGGEGQGSSEATPAENCTIQNPDNVALRRLQADGGNSATGTDECSGQKKGGGGGGGIIYVNQTGVSLKRIITAVQMQVNGPWKSQFAEFLLNTPLITPGSPTP